MWASRKEDSGSALATVASQTRNEPAPPSDDDDDEEAGGGGDDADVPSMYLRATSLSAKCRAEMRDRYDIATP